MTTASHFKACVSKSVTGAFCLGSAPRSKCNVGRWRAAPLSQITLMSALSRDFFYFTFLAQDVFQPRIKAKLRTVWCRNILLSCSNCMFACSLPAGMLAQVGKAWDGLMLVWELNRPYICHWSRTERDSSPELLGTLAPLQQIHSCPDKNHIIFKYIPGDFRGSFLPGGLVYKPVSLKAGVMSFLINGVYPNGMIQIQGIFGVLWSKDSWFILPSLAWCCYFAGVIQAQPSLKMSLGALGHVRHTQGTTIFLSQQQQQSHRPATLIPTLANPFALQTWSLVFSHPISSPHSATSQTTPWKCQPVACIPAAPSWASPSLLFLLPVRRVGCCTRCLSCVNFSGNNPCSDLLLSSCVNFLHSTPLPSCKAFISSFVRFSLTCLLAQVAEYVWSVAPASACHPDHASTEHRDSDIMHIMHVGRPQEVAEAPLGFFCPVWGVWNSGILSRLSQWWREIKGCFPCGIDIPSLDRCHHPHCRRGDLSMCLGLAA